MHAAYNASTNRQTGDAADANGNLGVNQYGKGGNWTRYANRQPVQQRMFGSGMAMKRSLWALFMTLAASCALVQDVKGGGLRRIWELQLAKVIAPSEHPNDSQMPVLALRFSADGKRLAVVADLYRQAGELASHLVVLNVQQPSEGALRFEIGPNEDEEEFGADPYFGWAPDGNTLTAGGIVVHLARGDTCKLPTPAVVLQDNRLIGPTILAYRTAGPPHLTTYDTNCAVRDHWDTDHDWAISAVSTQRALLLVQPVVLSAGRMDTSQGLLVDPLRKTILRSGLETRGTVFAEGGRVLCNGTRPGEYGRFPPSCHDADSGAKIAEASQINGGVPLAAATGASRIVASDVHVKPFLFLDYDSDNYTARRVVWDFRTRKEVAAWKPQEQQYEFPFPREPKRLTRYFRFAISPDGQYVADGGSGIVRLYKIVP